VNVAGLAIAVPVAVIVFALAVVTGAAGIGVVTASPPCVTASPWPPAATNAPSEHLDEEQTAYANVIIAVGVRDGHSTRAQVIAVASALQESSLRNLPPGQGDLDSVGLFQQRPSQGWGTPQQLLDPEYAASGFYQALMRVPHWQNMSLAVAAQAVQRSAAPGAYREWESLATALVSAASAADRRVAGSCGDAGTGQAGDETVALPAGFSLPAGTPAAVVAAIGWGLAQVGTSYVYGGDCTDARGPDPAQHCDCSSLMMRAYAVGGVILPRTTVGQVEAGMRVSDVSRLLPGDLVFIPGSLGTASRPRHVGMFLGFGLILQAPRTGETVKISPLSRWADSIAAIRRVIPTGGGGMG
jgi:cell wall-associated NlpC family hydrolase